MGISGRGGSGSSRSGSGAANDEERELADVKGAWLDISDSTSLQDAGFWMEEEEIMAQLEAYYKLTGLPQALDGSFYATSLDESKVGG